MSSIAELITNVNKKFNFNIKDISYFEMAFTHSSYTNEKNIAKHKDYERLEFLGDAVLELVTSEFLFKNFKELPEGKLTKLRSSIVCEPTLEKYAKDLHFDKFILLGRGEEKIGGRKRPALLADIFESFIGALYLTKGLDSVKIFLENTLFYEVKDYNYQAFVDYKTILQEEIFKIKLGDIKYVLLNESGPSHDKEFTTGIYISNKEYGKGIGKTKKESEQLAAKSALKKLNISV